MEYTAASRRAVPSGLPAMVLAACIGLIVIFAYAPEGPPPRRTSVVAAVALDDNDNDDALFNLANMLPGDPPEARCIRITYTGEPNTGTIFIAATYDPASDLAPYLRVKVERGTAGVAKDCSDFGGSPGVVFDGTLAGLRDTDPAVAETTTEWAPVGTESRTFRITVAIPANETGALGKSATDGTFQWMLVPDAGTPAATTPAPTTPAPTTPAPTTPAPTTPAPTTPAPTTPAPTTPGPTTPAPTTPGPTTPAPTTPGPTPTTPDAPPSTTAPPTTPVQSPDVVPSPAPPADPDPQPADPSPVPAEPVTPGPGESPTPTPTPTPTTAPTPTTVPTSPAPRLEVTPPAAGPAAPPPGGLAKARAKVAAAGKAVADAAKAVAKAVAKAAEHAAELAARTAEDGALPVSGIGVLLAFLALQNQIDRRDPKLSLAPVSEEYLEFMSPPESGPTGPDHSGADRPEGEAP